jgi:hypothetical protein
LFDLGELTLILGSLKQDKTSEKLTVERKYGVTFSFDLPNVVGEEFDIPLGATAKAEATIKSEYDALKQGELIVYNPSPTKNTLSFAGSGGVKVKDSLLVLELLANYTGDPRAIALAQQIREIKDYLESTGIGKFDSSTTITAGLSGELDVFPDGTAKGTTKFKLESQAKIELNIGNLVKIDITQGFSILVGKEVDNLVSNSASEIINTNVGLSGAKDTILIPAYGLSSDLITEETLAIEQSILGSKATYANHPSIFEEIQTNGASFFNLVEMA